MSVWERSEAANFTSVVNNCGSNRGYKSQEGGTREDMKPKWGVFREGGLSSYDILLCSPGRTVFGMEHGWR